jgi:UDP-glucuronate decarboxylase
MKSSSMLRLRYPLHVGVESTVCIMPRSSRIITEDLSRILAAPVEWGKLADATILVTGAAGFFASYVVLVLLAAGEELGFGKRSPSIVGLVRDRNFARARFNEYLDSPRLNLIEQDVCDPLPEHIQADYIIHAASPASPTRFGSDPVGTIRPNTIGTERMLELAKRCVTERLLFVSSSEVYGTALQDENPIKENSSGCVDQLDPRSCYAESKRLGESMCLAWFNQYSVPISIIRPFHIYGPGIRPDDGRIFSDFVYDIVNHRDLTIFSDGKARRSFCYLSDATEAVFRVLLGNNRDKIYNLGNPSAEISIERLGELLISLYPERNLRLVRKKRTVNGGYIKSAISRSCPSIERLENLGWKPKTSLEVGFRRTIESIES